MKWLRAWVLTVGLVTGLSTLCVEADIVWSGSQYQRAYHDLSALDLNQDGTNDFIFNQVVTEFSDRQIWIEPTDGQIMITSDPGFLNPLGKPLPTGATIGSNLNNPDYAWESATSFLFVYGVVMGNPSVGGFFGDGYLGVSFNIEESTHYGWIEISHDRDGVRRSPDDLYLYIHGWAWEAEADTPIIAGAIPEPSSAMLLIVGAGGMWFARQKRFR